MVIDSIGYFVVAPGAAGVAAAAVANDSLVVKNCNLDKRVELISWWAKNQVSGFHQLTWPSGNDQTRGIRSRVVLAEVYPRFAREWAPVIRPQEAVAVTVGGSAVAGDVECGVLQYFFEDMPGVNSNLIMPDELYTRGIKAVSVEDTTGAPTSSQWSGSRALNANFDLLQANTDYAVLGVNIGALCGALALRGPDIGNLRMAVPGLPTNALLTESYFLDLCETSGWPCIPVINSANKGSTFTDVLQDENVVVVPFSWNLVQLAPR